MSTALACTPHQTVKAALQCALDLLRDPTHWRRGTYAMNAQGLSFSEIGVINRSWEVDEEEPPEFFCLVGAVRFCAQGASVQQAALWTVVTAINRRYPDLVGLITLRHDIPDFNDSPRVQHDQILGVLEEAIDVASDGVDAERVSAAAPAG